MSVSQKTQYALRALFELAKRHQSGPAKISDIAAAQQIPPRFLEVILNELKQGGFTDSRRGKEGGYFLAKLPRDVTVGDVIRFVQGPFYPVDHGERRRGDQPVHPGEPGAVFLPLWNRVEQSLSDIYDRTTLRDLIDEEKRLEDEWVPDYTI